MKAIKWAIRILYGAMFVTLVVLLISRVAIPVWVVYPPFSLQSLLVLAMSVLAIRAGSCTIKRIWEATK
jgi:hypothetical protein